MKKVLFAVITLVIIAGMGAILMNNKAKSDAKSKVPPPKAVAVTVSPIGRQVLTGDLSLVGTIAANREVLVASEAQGRVLSVGPRVGDNVHAGALLARVDDELKRAAVANAQANYDKAKQDLDRYQWMKDQNDGGVADIQVETARQTFKGSEAALIVAQRQLRDTRITAPISGVLTARPVEIGTTLMPGNAVATIVDISQLKVKVNVPEEDVFKLRHGDRVAIATDVYPGETFDGHITMIGAKADEAHTYPVEITVVNSSKHPLKAGMFGRVSFTSLPSRNALVIPREAIVGSVKDAQVFVIQGHTAKLRSIVVGVEAGTKVEVLSGLQDGEQVVISGQNNLRDGVEIVVNNQTK
ncbi:MAG: efflux RND transporter periplasmic adaptor subunit [Bacteroidetes bacterium]|nr:efflux RND transporter periplasmic adaptor subunit [Bacteroidota bacterium]